MLIIQKVRNEAKRVCARAESFLENAIFQVCVASNSFRFVLGCVVFGNLSRYSYDVTTTLTTTLTTMTVRIYEIVIFCAVFAVT